jgi:hypothetical protein
LTTGCQSSGNPWPQAPRTELADNAEPHRSSIELGAKLFIVD